MRLLVTGGCGFIGAHFIRFALNQLHVESVLNIDCLTYAANPDNLKDVARDPRYTFRQMNIRDSGGVKGVIKKSRITHVVHMAAESHVDRSISNPEEFIDTNVAGTFNLLNAVRGVGCFRRFLHVSTDEVYGSIDSGYSHEGYPLNPSSPYSASKAASDMLVLAYHKTYGVETLITRSSNNYGPGQFGEKFIPTIVRSIQKRKAIPIYGDGLYMRDWIHVEDNVRGIWAVLMGAASGEIYNISSGKPVTNIDVVGAICEIIDRGDSLNLIDYVPDRPGHDRRYAPDSGKIRARLKWCPLHTFASSLTGTVRSYME